MSTELRLSVGEDEAVQPGLHSNPVEFDGIISRVVEPFPGAKKFHGGTEAGCLSHFACFGL
jgi:hypothetical protein